MRHPARIGVLRLTNSAPAILGDAEGLFAAQGVEVGAQVETCRANIPTGSVGGSLMRPPCRCLWPSPQPPGWGAVRATDGGNGDKSGRQCDRGQSCNR